MTRIDTTIQQRGRLGGQWTLLATVGFVAWAAMWSGHLIDDAYISLRYSQHLVDGESLVFNAGERVEGYTNFLWVLLGAVPLALGWAPEPWLMALSLLSTLVLLVATRSIDRSTAEGDPGGSIGGFAIPAVLWLLTLESLAYYATTTMETTLFAALFAAGVALGLRELDDGRSRGSWLVFVALALTRPEGAPLFVLTHGALVVAACVRALAENGLARTPLHAIWTMPALRRAIRDGLAFGMVYGSYFAWRWWYFGELMPNTYHAKVTGGREQWINGFIGLRQWALAQPLFALALLGAAVLSWRQLSSRPWRSNRWNPGLLAVTLITVGYTAYVVTVGGDFMPFFRFFLPLAPLYAVLTSRVVSAVLPAEATPRRVVLAALVGVHIVASVASEQDLRAFVAHRTTVVGLTVGEHLEKTLPTDALIGVNTAGAIPYASGLPTIDMLGLTDKAIARHPVYVISPLWAGHRRGWGEYVLDRQPRLVLWYNAAGARDPHYLGDHQLADDPWFRFFYQRYRQELESPEPEGTRLARFLGTPFGKSNGPETLTAPDLGSRFVVHDDGFVPWTEAWTAPVVLHAFLLRQDNAELWPLRDAVDKDLDAFLDRVLEHWRSEALDAPAVDPEAHRRVDILCQQALARIEAQDFAAAKQLLSQAAALNTQARSPLVYQYITNLAVLDGDLFLAVHAQQEALRLEPGNPLYRRNLLALLRRPYDGEDG